MGPQKLLIADASQDFIDALVPMLADRFQLFTATDGNQALALLHQERCQLMLLDLALPHLDGLSLLEQAVTQDLHPSVIVTTSLINVYIQDKAARLGVKFMIRKPCNMQVLAQRVVDVFQSLPHTVQDEAYFLSNALLSLSFSSKHLGYRYLTSAIICMADTPGLPITKVLYPMVAKKCNCHYTNVERPMRTALGCAWDRGNRQLWQSYFPGIVSRPSTTEFIIRMAQDLSQYRQQLPRISGE